MLDPLARDAGLALFGGERVDLLEGRLADEPAEMARATTVLPPLGVSVRSRVNRCPRPTFAIAASKAAIVARSPSASLTRIRVVRPVVMTLTGGNCGRQSA